VNKTGTIELGENGCAFLAGELTFESVPALFRETEKLFKGSRPVTLIDLSGVTAADSAGLALLLEWQAIQKASSGTLEINNAPPGLLSLATLCEADEVMSMSGRHAGP
jgi:phospholipid transport system transporter-binding protein